MAEGQKQEETNETGQEITVTDALNLAVKYHLNGNLTEAESIYRKIIEKYPNNSDAFNLLGVIKCQDGEYEDSIKNIQKAIQLNPSIAIYYGNLAMAYNLSGNDNEAENNFKEALKLDAFYPGAHLAYYNLGIFSEAKGNIFEALEHYDKSIELDKDFSDAHWNKSLILLLLGRYEEGWKEYEYRFKKKQPSDKRIFNKSKWDGSLLNGKKILVISEQGFGDNIQFIRYLPLIKEKGGEIILECKKEIEKLFNDSFEINRVIEKNLEVVPDVEFDVYIHLMDLPSIFNTNLINIPNKFPYLKADSGLVINFKEKINKISNGKFKIGIIWSGNPNQENDKNRSASFDNFKLLKKIPGVVLFSLQKGEAAGQLDDPDIIDLSNNIANFADTAAIIENMDLIVSVDTSVTHLAGAMGKQTWVLLAHKADWRWLIDRHDSPWYPSVKLFRQKNPGDWDNLLNEVNEEIRNYFIESRNDLFNYSLGLN